jgi:transcriptional regulator with XRE-family HTH domain
MNGTTSPPGREPVMLTIGERIALWRVRRGLSKKQLADEVGISAKQLSRYESDLIPPPTDVLRKLVVRLGISADYVIGLKEEASRVKPHGKERRLRSVPSKSYGRRLSDYVQPPLADVAR